MTSRFGIRGGARRRRTRPSPLPPPIQFQPSSPQSLLDLIRRIQLARIANLGEENIAGGAQERLAQTAQRVSSPEGIPRPEIIPTEPPPSPDRGLLQNLLQLPGFNLADLILPDRIAGALPVDQRLNEATNPLNVLGTAEDVSTGFFSALPESVQRTAFPTLGLLPGVIPSEDVRGAARGEIARGLSGEQSLVESAQGLRSVQGQRSFLEQLLSTSFTSPVGLVENVLPIGFGGKVARAADVIGPAATRLATQGVRPRLIAELPTARQTFSQLFAKRPQLLREADKGPRPLVAMFEQPYRIFNPQALKEFDSPVARIEVLWDRHAELVPEAGNALTQRVLAMGDPNVLFQLDPNNGFRSILPGVNGLTFNEIAENIDDLRIINLLSPEQNAWFQRFGDIVTEMNEYLVREGIPREALFTSKVDNYFPRVWEMFKDIELRKGGRGQLGAIPFYEKFRTYETIEDALQAGFSVANPMEAVEMLFTSMYKQVADKQILDIMRQYGFTIKDRMNPKIVETLTRSKERLGGVRKASEIVRLLSTPGLQSRAPKAGTRFAGRALAEQHAPELMTRLDAINTIPLVADRRVAFQALRSQAARDLDDARKGMQIARKEATLARAQAKGQGFMGEVQFPGTGMGGRIITPDDLADFINPEGAMREFKTLPREDILRLQKLMAPRAKGTLDAMQSVSSAVRTAQAGLDGGVGAIHLLPLMLTKPNLWMKSMGVSLQAAKSPLSMARFIDDHFDTVQKLMQRNQFHGGGSEYVEAIRRGGLLRSGAEKIPGKAGEAVVRGLEGFEAQFNGALVAAKVYLWEAMEPLALRQGTPEALDQLASHIAKLTGTISMANMGITPTTRKVLGSMLLFAPRYRMAIYGLMTDVFRGGLKGELARESLGKMMYGGLLMYSVMASRTGQEMNLDPRSGKFLTLKMGDSNIGFGSAFVSLARFGAGFLEQSFNDPVAIAKVWDKDSTVTRFIRGQMAPGASIGWDIVTGKNFMGDPTTGSFPDFLSNVVAENLLPFWLSGFADYPRAGWASAPAEFGGARAYPVSLWERANADADVVAMQKHGRRFKHLRRRLEQQIILRDNPDIQKKFDENNTLWDSRVTDALSVEARRVTGTRVNEYRGEIDGFIETVYQPSIDTAAADFERGKITGKQAREILKSHGLVLGAFFDSLGRSKEEDGKGFGDVIEALDNLGVSPDAHVEDIAYFEYLAKVIHGDFEVVDPITGEETGEYDFKARQEQEDRILEKYGPVIWSYIQERRTVSKEIPPVFQELNMGRELLQTYWDVGRTILEALERQDLLPRWNEWQRSNSAQQTLLAVEYPLLRQVATGSTRARQQFREGHQDVDAWLFRWGYSGNLRHPDNLLRELDEILRTPVFLNVGVGNVQ